MACCRLEASPALGGGREAPWEQQLLVAGCPSSLRQLAGRCSHYVALLECHTSSDWRGSMRCAAWAASRRIGAP